jgi:hypothetical protein
MKKKNSNILFVLIIFLVFLILPSFLSAQDYDNIGFKKDVPEAIRKACPMCDEFLDVKWIDEKRMIGKLRAEVYKNEKKSNSLYFLVRLENPVSESILYRGNGITYEITEKEYYSKDFEKLIKEAEYIYNKGFLFMDAYVKGVIVRKFTQGPIPSTLSMESYFRFSRTICIFYPSGEYIFIAETKKPFSGASLSNGLKQKYDSILKYAKGKCAGTSGCITDQIKDCDAIDVNFDGIDDYIFRFWVREKRNVSILFSKDKAYDSKDISDCIPHVPVYYAAREQRAVFFGNCNLTEQMKGGR